MTDNSTRLAQTVISDADDALYLRVDPNKRFNRIRTTDPRRLARIEQLKALREIDVSTAKGAAAKKYFKGIVDRALAGIEGSCLVVHGRTGAGKSHIISRLVADPDLQEKDTEEGKYRPLLNMVAPAPCTLKTLGLAILRELGYRPKRRLEEHQVWERVYANLYAQGVAIVVIDEMHNVLAGRSVTERQKIAATLKTLMVQKDNPIQLIFAGLGPVKTFVNRYSEIRRRAHFVELAELDPVKDAKKISQFLKALEDKLDVKTCGFTKHDMPHRFSLASRGLVGRMAYFVQEAATIAISLDHDAVEAEHLAEAYRRPYDVTDNQNPFAVLNPHLLRFPKRGKGLEDDDKTYLRGTKKYRSEEDSTDELDA